MGYKSNRVTFNCEFCGIEVSQPVSQYAKNNHHFCTKECSSSWKTGENNPAYNSIEYKCDECGKDILVNVYQTKQRDKHFCSQACSGKYNGEQRLGSFNVPKSEYPCDNCGKTLMLSQTDLNRNSTHYCSVDCRKEGTLKLGIFNKENNGNWKGGNVNVICNGCGKEFIIDYGHYKFNTQNRSGIFYCNNQCFGIEQKRKWDNNTHPLIRRQPSKKGKESTNWNDDFTKKVRDIRNSPENYQWKKSCLERDDFKCIICNDDSKTVHHKIPMAYFISKYNLTSKEDAKNCKGLYDINNGVTLCKEHHHRFHTKYGKAFFTQEDFEEFYTSEKRLYNL